MNTFKWLLIIVMSIMTTFVKASDSHNYLIREDRIWKSVYNCNLGWYLDYMKFDGSIEYEGHIYHKVRTFKKEYLNYDGISDILYIDHIEDDIDITEAYLREENGIVYTLLDCASRKFVDPLCDNSRSYNLKDYPIYNFNMTPGTPETLYTFYTRSFVVNEHPFNCISREMVEIDGEEYLSLTITMEDDLFEYKIIEGIGITDWGCLHHHELEYKESSLLFMNIFCSVLDLEGKVIYSSLDIVPNKNHVNYKGSELSSIEVV